MTIGNSGRNMFSAFLWFFPLCACVFLSDIDSIRIFNLTYLILSITFNVYIQAVYFRCLPQPQQKNNNLLSQIHKDKESNFTRNLKLFNKIRCRLCNICSFSSIGLLFFTIKIRIEIECCSCPKRQKNTILNLSCICFFRGRKY